MATRKDVLLSSLPPLEHYAEQLNLDAIAQAILGPEGTPKIAEYDYEDIKKMVWTIAEKWLVRDIYDLDIDGVEEQYEETILFTPKLDSEPEIFPQRFKGVKDLTGTLRGRLNVTKKLAGKKVVIDWKTTHNTLNTDWDERLLDSWQWKKYLYFSGAEVMLYRGISREGKTRELMIERPANLEDDVYVQLESVARARKALIDANLQIWPRKMPSACGAFGRECPFWTDCREVTMPRGCPEPDSSLSYSSMDKFLLCPERYRRERVFDGSEDTEESLFGQAVHRGAAELYTQAKQLFQ